MSTQTKPPVLDFTVANHGSICILTGLTEDCKAWIESHVGDSETLHWNGGIVVETNYMGAIVDGLFSEGFNGAER